MFAGRAKPQRAGGHAYVREDGGVGSAPALDHGGGGRDGAGATAAVWADGRHAGGDRVACEPTGRRSQGLRFCYQAGSCGYGTCRQLIAMGHECRVVARSLLPRRPRSRPRPASAMPCGRPTGSRRPSTGTHPVARARRWPPLFLATVDRMTMGLRQRCPEPHPCHADRGATWPRASCRQQTGCPRSGDTGTGQGPPRARPRRGCSTRSGTHPLPARGRPGPGPADP